MIVDLMSNQLENLAGFCEISAACSDLILSTQSTSTSVLVLAVSKLVVDTAKRFCWLNDILTVSLLLEFLLFSRISGILGFVTTNKRPSDELVHYFAGSNKVRFKRPIVPGDQIVLESRLIAAKHNIWKFDCKALVDNELACTAEIMTAERTR